MRFEEKQPARPFVVGNTIKFEMQDCGSLHLQPDEQVTFVTERGHEFDVARKAWGFYATPSLNGRLRSFGLRAVLIRNQITDRYFVLLVQEGEEPAFESYLVQESCEVVSWLDSAEALSGLRAALKQASTSV